MSVYTYTCMYIQQKGLPPRWCVCVCVCVCVEFFIICLSLLILLEGGRDHNELS